MASISVVVNALNEQDTLGFCLDSVKGWADEIVVVDDGSVDQTVAVAKSYTEKVFHHQSVGYVEPARNFAIDKASADWLLILDADEQVSKELRQQLSTISQKDDLTHVWIARKNIIFNKWIRHTGWWPDYHLRFFRKGSVVWPNTIHAKPQVNGQELKLEAKEELAIIHHNYNSLSQYLSRLDRYASIQAQDMIKEGYHFDWRDLIRQPTQEFLRRYFAWQGFKDGLHGLCLSLLQAFAVLVVYLKVWESTKFSDQPLIMGELEKEMAKSQKEIDYWLAKTSKQSWIGRILRKTPV